MNIVETFINHYTSTTLLAEHSIDIESDGNRNWMRPVIKIIIYPHHFTIKKTKCI